MSVNTDPNSKTDNLANGDCRPVICSRRTNVPKAKFHIGDEVDVSMAYPGDPETYRACVCGIRLVRHGDLDYTVMEEGGVQTDGYTEKWFSPANVDGDSSAVAD